MLTELERDRKSNAARGCLTTGSSTETPLDGCMGEVPELPGCYTSGDTPAETLTNLDEAMAGWIESRLISVDPIPDPGEGPDSRGLISPSHGGLMCASGGPAGIRTQDQPVMSRPL